jgi:hypothetical protein
LLPTKKAQQIIIDTFLISTNLSALSKATAGFFELKEETEAAE